MVLKEQDFDYSYPHIYTHNRTSLSSSGVGETAVETMSCEVDDENFLTTIGDVYT